MPFAFVLDEDLRGPLYGAILSHNAGGHYPVDAVRVGDPPDLPLRSKDPYILAWAERAGRPIVTHDFSTMPGHLAGHLAAGNHSPGVLSVKPNASYRDTVDALALIAHAGDATHYADRYEYIP